MARALGATQRGGTRRPAQGGPGWCGRGPHVGPRGAGTGGLPGGTACTHVSHLSLLHEVGAFEASGCPHLCSTRSLSHPSPQHPLLACRLSPRRPFLTRSPPSAISLTPPPGRSPARLTALRRTHSHCPETPLVAPPPVASSPPQEDTRVPSPAAEGGASCPRLGPKHLTPVGQRDRAGLPSSPSRGRRRPATCSPEAAPHLDDESKLILTHRLGCHVHGGACMCECVHACVSVCMRVHAYVSVRVSICVRV